MGFMKTGTDIKNMIHIGEVSMMYLGMVGALLPLLLEHNQLPTFSDDPDIIISLAKSLGSQSSLQPIPTVPRRLMPSIMSSTSASLVWKNACLRWSRPTQETRRREVLASRKITLPASWRLSNNSLKLSTTTTLPCISWPM